MRIPIREVLFSGQDQWPEFDRCQEPLPDELQRMFCFASSMALRNAENSKPS